MNKASKELLDSIQPEMKLTRDFFKRVYGYAITDPGYEDLAISRLEETGCSRAREYYNTIKETCDQEYDESVRPIADGYYRQLLNKWKQEDKKKEGEEKRKWEIMQDLQQLNDSELLKLWQNRAI